MNVRPDVTIVRVIRVTFRRGAGVAPDPVRIVTAYFDGETGDLLFEIDPISGEGEAPTVCPHCGWRSEPWPEHPPADLLAFMQPVEVPQ